MKMDTRVFTFACWLVASGCHSANWSPPEPQQAPEPTVPPPVVTPPPTPSTPEPSANPNPSASAAPASSAVESSEPPTSTSAALPPVSGAPAPSTSAAPAASADAKPKSTAKSPTKAPEGAAAPSDAYTGPDPCQSKTFHYSAVGSACKKGGRKPVKDIMRGVVKKAKAAGQDIQCTSCHVDTSSYLLKPNAVSDMKQWL
jgi:hypothetical protein